MWNYVSVLFFFSFNHIIFSCLSTACLQTSQGVKEFSVPVGLDAKVKVDLVVVGSVAVSEKGNHQSVLASCFRSILHQVLQSSDLVVAKMVYEQRCSFQ